MGLINRVTKIKFTKTLKEKGIIIFTLHDLKKLFGLQNENTIKHLVIRLTEENIIKRLVKNKYLFLFSSKSPSDFGIANNLIVPSYISLESALSYYGLISQFPYRVTSLTLGKSKRFKVGQKIFIYAKIKKEYFKDFIKIGDFLIATREKALFDYCYFIYKGLRPKNMISELAIFLKERSTRNYFINNGFKKLC